MDPTAKETEVATLGIVGFGQMGGGIAQVAADRGIKVIVIDANPDLIERGQKMLAVALKRLEDKGKINSEHREKMWTSIQPGLGYESLAECDFVIEAASEDPALKQRIFRELDAHVQKDAILASNTSSISITLLGAQTRRAEQVIGMHFMNPVPLMQLLEVIRGLSTSEQTYQATLALGRRLGKDPVTARDMPGFIVNRLLIPFLNEACFALQEGLGTIEDIDKGIKLGLNHKMGPFELADLIGLDTCLSIAEVLHRELGEDKYRPSPLLRQYVTAGRLGRKTGRGFYNY